ncbi:MAG TPA: hypothetical protein VGB10_07260 [Bacteroidota bacterium]
MPDSSIILSVLRRLLLALFVAGVVITGTELFLLEHTEEWQIAPLVLLALSLLVLGWHAMSKSRTSIRTFQAVMLLFIVGGISGIALHYNGNVEFELEMYPSLSGIELFSKAMHGAFPALAPSAMIHLGLLGFAYTFRHPLLTNSNKEQSFSKGVTHEQK